jgi:drug/metabolite transporter (DMT)-like permease
MYNKSKGIFFILLSAFSFACMSACVRLAGDMNTFEKAMFRNLVAMIIAGVMVARQHVPTKLTAENRRYVWLRSVFGTIGLACNYYAISRINLADANMLNKMSPFFAVIFSAIILKEKIGLKQILLVIGAFLGSLLIIKPSPSNLQLFPAVIGAIGGVGAGAAYTCVRAATMHGAPKTLVVFFFSTFSTIAMIPLALLDFTMPSPMQWLWLILCGVCGACGQFAVTNAYSYAPAREISVYDYSQIIFSALLGFFIFDQIPDALSFLGYVIIIVLALINSGHLSLKKKSA